MLNQQGNIIQNYKNRENFPFGRSNIINSWENNYNNKNHTDINERNNLKNNENCLVGLKDIHEELLLLREENNFLEKEKYI